MKKIISFVLFFTLLLTCTFITSYAIEVPSDTMIDTLCVAEKDMDTGSITNKTFENITIPTTLTIPNEDDGASTFSIIGDDGREQIGETTNYPYSAIALIKIDWPGLIPTSYGTAWIIADNIAVTAGHCLYDTEEDVWAKSITLYAAKDGLGFWNNPYGTVKSKKLCIAQNYIDYETSDYDWGLIALKENISDETGIINFTYASNSQLTNANIEISGYPYGDGLIHDFRQLTMSGTISSFTDRRLYYTVDTTGGQSGSPILGANHVAYGIHTHGTNNGTYNSGTRITEAMYNTFHSFIAENTL